MATTSEITVRTIVKDIHSDSYYLIDTNPNALIGPRPTAIRGPDTVSNLERYLKIANYYDFYYVPTYRGEPQRRQHTQHYKAIFRPDYIDPTPYDGTASGWWDIETFCNATYYAKFCESSINTY